MLAYAAVLPVLSGWTCARGIMGWRMVREERVGNGVDQHQITNGVGCRPWNHPEPSGKELGHVLADVSTRGLRCPC